MIKDRESIYTKDEPKNPNEKFQKIMEMMKGWVDESIEIVDQKADFVSEKQESKISFLTSPDNHPEKFSFIEKSVEMLYQEKRVPLK